jgi:UDPglucose--hexose-1-phosphate uridylyltransferase
VPERELQADDRLGGCAVCALLAQELADGRRVVYESEHVAVYVPYAARWAYEAHVVLRAHRASLLDCTAAELASIADALRTLVRGYDALFDAPFPYVMAVHQAPTRSSPPAGSHLHVEFYPPLRAAGKLKYLAGSEQGGGTFIADTLPEESAVTLREAIARGA